MNSNVQEQDQEQDQKQGMLEKSLNMYGYKVPYWLVILLLLILAYVIYSSCTLNCNFEKFKLTNMNALTNNERKSS